MNKKIVDDLAKMCEYMYRKGVYDSGMNGDPTEVMEIVERDNWLTSYKMIDVDEISDSKFQIQIDNLIVISNNMNCPSFRNFMLFATRQKREKREILTLLDTYYRTGLEHGLTIKKDDCTSFFENLGRGNQHYCLKRKSKLKRDAMIDDMKKHCNDINLERAKIDEKCPSYSLLGRFIEDGRR